LETLIKLATKLLNEFGVKIPKYLKIPLLCILIGICVIPIYRILFPSKISSITNTGTNNNINQTKGNNNQATIISQQTINNYSILSTVDSSTYNFKMEPKILIFEGFGAEILKAKKEEFLRFLKKSKINKIIISLTYSNQILQVNGDLYYYPGGFLKIKVNDVQCSNASNSDFFIPRTEPFGNPHYDVEQQIKNSTEKIIRQHLEQIIQTVANCI
jgi:hypothetical protein